MPPVRLRDAALAGFVALVLMVLLPSVALLSREVGPAARVAVHAYLISAESLGLAAAAMLTASLLGVETYRWLARRRLAKNERRQRRFLRVTWSMCLVLLAWTVAPQLTAFPDSGSAEQREAWARRHVPQFPQLASLVASLPEVERDVGPVSVVAPTSNEEHVAGQEMNGYDLRFALDVIGQRGRGVLRVACTLDEQRVLSWDSANWTYAGHTTPLAAPR